jgi:RNA recognition motif-containing protein
MDIFVSNIPFKLTEEGLKELFSPFGEVSAVKIIIDKRTRLNKGYGFVTMNNNIEANLAIKKNNGLELMDRKLVVSKSQKVETLKVKPKLSFNAFGAKKKTKNWLGDDTALKEKAFLGDKPKKFAKRRGTGRGTTY